MTNDVDAEGLDRISWRATFSLRVKQDDDPGDSLEMLTVHGRLIARRMLTQIGADPRRYRVEVQWSDCKRPDEPWPESLRDHARYVPTVTVRRKDAVTALGEVC